jgi:hypothetical protein
VGWLVRGDILLNHNIPGQHILDPAAGVLFFVVGPLAWLAEHTDKSV